MNNLTIAVQTIKDSVSAYDTGMALGLEIRHGRCQCPVHGGKDYNCVLYKGNRGYYCHVCKSGGDCIKLAQEYLGLSFKDTVAWFGNTFHLGLDLNSRITPERQKQAENALQMRKKTIEFQEWKERMQFDMSLTADQIVERLEKQRDENRPRRFSEEWSDLFCQAVELLPEARKFTEECTMNCTKERIQ